MESKKKIYDLIPQEYYPRTFFVKAGTPANEVWQKIKDADFKFPLVGKPDIGGRGRAVKKLLNKQDVVEYATTLQLDYLVQEYIPYEMEAGIFYYRLPNEKKGHVTGIVAKEFLTIKGDGVSTIRQLLEKDQRYLLQLDVLEERFGAQLHNILPKGEKKVLVPYGNHCRGAKFIDASAVIDEQLEASIDKVCQQIDGFYYGRMDIKFSNWEDLRHGKNFSIIELNGAGSEPTHMYDSNHSIFFAWKEIIRHWKYLYKISMQNKQISPFMSFKDGVKMFKDDAAYSKVLEAQVLTEQLEEDQAPSLALAEPPAL